MSSAPPSEGTLSGVAGLPTGTITFLFSDIEGSTQRWDRDRAAMQDAVRRHDAIIRDAIGAHDGRVFKTIGDAFCAVFARAEDAIASALGAQRGLGATDFSAVDGLRVRMALHTGTADERDDDYFGPSVNRVARLLAIGHGGQVLVSGVTADLVQGDLPAQATLRDLGAHRLKDLARPEHVYQLLAPDLPRDFPALRSLDVLPNNLPPQLTSFVGRDAEVAEIAALVAPQRVVTIVGSGGVGKTRIALQVGANLLEGSGDGVWFVEFAPLADPALVPTTIASALGLTLPGAGEPLPALVNLLRPKRCLLILDNCEHLVDSVSAAASAIVRGCPQVAILASSRQGLGVLGEQTYRLPSLAVPTEGDAAALTAQSAAAYSAIALFAERARAADKRFTVTDENAPVVAEICRRLDGIALAIELAAARIVMLQPRELRARLDQRFRVLTGGSRDALPRQQTLRALIDWSHDLLDERERRLFRRLGIFVNGWTLDGATAVAADETLDELDVFDVLASLVDKSLVVTEFAGETTRYRLLQSTRAYAEEKLDAAAERDAIAERHLRYLHDLFVRVGAAYEQQPRDADVLVLEVELDDQRAALAWAAANGRIELGAELYGATNLWFQCGLLHESLDTSLRYAELLEGADSALASRMWSKVGQAAANVGQLPRAVSAGRRAVAIARASGDANAVADALVHEVSGLLRAGELAEARAALDEGERIAPPTPLRRHRIAERRALVARFEGDLEEAVRLSRGVAATARSLGNDQTLALANLAELEHQQGETRSSVAHAREALEHIGRRNGPFRPYLLMNLTGYLVGVDALDEAFAAGRAALEFLRSAHSDAVFTAATIEHMALAAALAGDLACAARLEGYADARIRTLGYHREFTEKTTYDRVRGLLRDGLPPVDLDALLAEGAAWPAEQAIAEALRATTACSGRARRADRRRGS